MLPTDTFTSAGTLTPIIENCPTIRVLYVQEVGNYDDTAHNAFKKLLEYIDKNKPFDLNQRAYYGMGLDNPHFIDKEICRFDACVNIGNQEFEASEGVQQKKIKKGLFAVFFHNKSYQELELSFQRIFKEWLPESDYSCSGMPFCQYSYACLTAPSPEPIEPIKIYIPIMMKA